jgi:hypothetical protein
VCELSSGLRTAGVAVIPGTCVEEADDDENGHEFENSYDFSKFGIAS